MDLGTWLRQLGLERYEQAFKDNDIEPHLLPTMTAEDLREIGVASLGHRKQLLAAIAALNHESQLEAESSPPMLSSTKPHAERRQLTVLFADLVGSTGLSSRLDPEEMREVLHAYQNVVTGIIARLGGYVARLMGDGVLAYFGWPQADESEAERAVQAGLTIVEAVAGLAAPDGEPLAARVGIASGLVVVGDLVGEGAAREEPVIGETPILAARLQEAAPAGSVMVDPATRRLLGEMFELREVGPIRPKGFAKPLTGFQVLGERASESRFEVLRFSRPLPMVGRDQELALLVERWRQATYGEGQAVLLVGEPGIGKSRLLQAALDAVAGEDQIVLRFQCSPYHTGTALWPFAQQLASAAGMATDDGEEQKLAKIEALLLRSGADLGMAVPVVTLLLGLQPGPGYPLPRLTPVQQRARTLTVLIDHLLGFSRPGPLLIAIEDVHWIDPTSLELVDQMLDRISGARALMLLTSRPDNQPTLGGHPHAMRLTLNRLGRGSAEAIATQLSGERTLAADLLNEIVTRADGVPLFIEELTKAVIETGTAGARSAIPSSLHSSLMARLDRVPGVKEVAQLAACIGREFTYPLLAAVSPVPDPELLTALDRLVTAELVFRRGTPPEASYSFKHALVRDAAYESLLKPQRQQVHAKIARALERLAPESADSEPEVLAQHYAEAGIVDRAVDFWCRAGRQALAHSAVAEAVVHLDKGLTLLTELPSGPERQRRELGLQLALGQASIAAKGFAAAETGRAYGRAHELCRELGDTHQLYPVLYGLSVFHFQRGELDEAQGLARELLRLGREGDNPTAQITGYRMIGSTLSQLGRFAESRDQFLSALSLYDPERDRDSAMLYAIDSRVMCTAWLSHLLLILGSPDQAIERDREVPAYVREVSHANTTAVALAWGCIFAQLLRDQHMALTRAEAVIDLATEQGFPLYRAAGRVIRGWALAHRGLAAPGVEEIRRGLADYAATGAQMWSPYFLNLLAEGERLAGRPVAGLQASAEAMERIDQMGLRWIEAEVCRTQGELLLAQFNPDPITAEKCFHRALAVAREQAAALWELCTATSLARLRMAYGDPQAAGDVLRPACDQFCGAVATRHLREAKELLDQLG